MVNILFISMNSVSSHKKKPLNYSEKKQVAEKMKIIAESLGVKCEHCHLEAEKGLRAADFRLLTDDGEYAHDEMFPLAKKFSVNCDYCHDGHKEFTKIGKIAEKDYKWIENQRKNKMNLNFTCETCHQLPAMKTDRPFQVIKKGSAEIRKK